MNYRLIVLTDGRGLLHATLASFLVHVRPLPAQVYVHGDGPAGFDEAAAAAGAFGPSICPDWIVGGTRSRSGFCAAVAECWRVASLPSADFVYWLEDDFLHQADVSLRELALVLERQPRLAQIALCRGPANEAELAAGGLVASRPSEFERRHAWFDRLHSEGAATLYQRTWLEHRSYWTTNPSLFRAELARTHPWPNEALCEGKFGASLRAAGYSFGLWGSGEPWVEHVGVRQGKGY